jgi:hypothetical protein
MNDTRFHEKLDKDIQRWDPQPPSGEDELAVRIVQRAGQARTARRFTGVGLVLMDIMEDWLPAPGRFFWVMAAAVVILTLVQYSLGRQRASETAAMIWKTSLANPISGQSLAGEYGELTKPAATTDSSSTDTP